MASSDGYDGEMETMLTYTDVTSLPGGVYFAGIQNSGEVIAGNDITFSKTLINIGKIQFSIAKVPMSSMKKNIFRERF